MSRAKTATKANLLAMGWGEEEATWRANAIDASKSYGARESKGREGKSVVAEMHDGRVVVAGLRKDGVIVGGCRLSPGMIRRELSQPFEWLGWEQDGVIARLADGTEIRKGETTNIAETVVRLSPVAAK